MTTENDNGTATCICGTTQEFDRRGQGPDAGWSRITIQDTGRRVWVLCPDCTIEHRAWGRSRSGTQKVTQE